MAVCHPVEQKVWDGTRVVLVGNPNVGKSAIFGALTHQRVIVSNYPGTTVEITQAALPNGAVLIDTPGTNSLTAQSDDERVTADYLSANHAEIGAVVQIADAKNLRRALLLTVQLSQLGLPLVLVLNMMDEAVTNGVHIDTDRLGAKLGIDVVKTVAVRGEGIDQVLAALPAARVPHVELTALPHDGYPPRALKLKRELHTVADLLHEVISHSAPADRRWVRQLGRWMVHPVLGWTFLLAVLWLVYKFVGEFGAGTLVGFLEETVFGQWINPAATSLIDTVLPIPFIHDLLVGDYGIITMALSYGIAIVFPIVATFFLAFSILEDTGYLPRLAIMFNRVFNLLGLNGKAVLPMVLGLGCDTMATMSTRILETRKERLLVTLLLALGVPCSAQLGVVLGMVNQVSTAGMLLWAGVVIGTMFVVGWLAAKLLPGARSDFILELPPLRLPQIGNITVKTVARVEWYLKEVLPLFVVGTLILFALDKTGALAVVERLAAPLVVNALGLPAAATGAFLIGFLRRDYGAAGLFALALAGELNTQQMIVSLIVVTLFVPCVANVLMIAKEYGAKIALYVVLTVFPLAFAVGALVNVVLNWLHIQL
ncbi:MAG: ferrous iron transporter B [Chloroflexi bacterium]|uniref:ferrous iron transporter B n=1 Tax=Candidatus Flexifilum breve TaxID=3140694 RepID=UPI0031370E64|nr:ferrous iron transporter B [Chloroflexota bacterium]